MENISLVIPIYNEENNIINLVNEIKNTLKIENIKYELILVDDCSIDNSNKYINELKDKNFFNIIIERNKKNMGQSYSIFRGISIATSETIVTIDGDGQNNPKDILRLLKYYFNDDQIKLVGGIRNKRIDSKIKILSSIIANKIRSYILDDKCSDTGCSLKVFDRSIFLSFPYFDGMHRFLPALFSGYNFKTLFINVDHRPRIYGSSKYGTFKRAFFGILDMIKVRRLLNKRKSLND